MVCLRQKAKIDYPCRWSYKVIAADAKHIELAIEKICISKEYELRKSNNSKSGKYVSMNFSTLVTSEEERVEIFNQLQENEKIKMVL